jgi:hypothetical protein
MQAQGFKVRLEDGSEVGPLDGAALRDWRTKGLISKATPVLPPGSRAWTTLGRVLDGAKAPNLSGPAGPSRRSGFQPAAGRSAGSARDVSSRSARAVTGRRSTSASRFGGLAAVLLLVLGGAVAYAALGPSLPGLAALLGLRAEAPPTAGPAPAAATEAAPAGRDAALAAARAATPHLSEAAAQALMDESAVGVLEPPELFRRGWLQVQEGMGALSREETRELRALTGALYSPLTSRERRALDAYLGRVRGRRTTSSEADAAEAAVVARAFGRLSAGQQRRLCALLEKAVLASLGKSPAA